MKTTLDWYKHDATASESPKFIALRASPYGWAGEGRFWALNGLIARSDNCQLDLGRKFAKAAIAEKLGFSPLELEDFICFLRDECELLDYQSGFVSTDRLLENLQEVMPDRIRCAEKRQKTTIAPRSRSQKTHPQSPATAGELEKTAVAAHILDSDSDKDKEQNGEVRPSALRPSFAGGDFRQRQMAESLEGIRLGLEAENVWG
jgi:hypothetical protein